MFNLGDHLRDLSERILVRFAFGYTHQKNREQYEWWDYEELVNNKSANIGEWNLSIQSESTLVGILNEAETRRSKRIDDCNREYGVPPDVAAKMIKTYIGYSPAYGGYICQLGPYLSQGFMWGAKHKIQQAVGKFSFYVLRRRKASPEEITSALSRKMNAFVKAYGNIVDLDPSDFSYTVKMQKEYDPKRGRQSYSIVRHFDSLDPNDPRVKEFFNNPVIEGGNSEIFLNAGGYQKVLRAYMGPWYDQVMRQMMTEQKKTEEQIVIEMMANPKVIQTVYGRSRTLWQQARNSGDAAALAVGTPPVYEDKSLGGYSGAQQETGPDKPKIKQVRDSQGNITEVTIPAHRTELLISTHMIQKEILQVMGDLRTKRLAPAPDASPVDEAGEIADALNKNPVRVKYNKNKLNAKNRYLKKLEELHRRQEAGEVNEDLEKEIILITDQVRKSEPVLWTSEDVNSVIGEIETEKLNNPAVAVQEISQEISRLDDSSGYDDLKTAYKMAALYFSAHRTDGATGAKIGTSSSIVFDPPENFQNYTSADLQKYVDAKLLQDPVKTEAPEPAPGVATPEEIQKEIGDIETTPERLAPEAVPGAVPGEVVPEGAAPEVEKPKSQQMKLKELEELMGYTLNNLIKIAEELDHDGKYDAAEEVHKVIRKYEEKL